MDKIRGIYNLIFYFLNNDYIINELKSDQLL